MCGQVNAHTQKRLRFSRPGLLVEVTRPVSGTFFSTEPAFSSSSEAFNVKLCLSENTEAGDRGGKTIGGET